NRIAMLKATVVRTRLSMLLRDGRVMTAGVERMALAEPLQRAQRATPRSVVPDALLRIHRTARMKTTASTERIENRRDDQSIEVERPEEEFSEDQLSNLRHSPPIPLVTPASSLSLALALATKTMSSLFENNAFRRQKAPRPRRLMRLRTTATPTFL